MILKNVTSAQLNLSTIEVDHLFGILGTVLSISEEAGKSPFNSDEEQEFCVELTENFKSFYCIETEK